MQQIAGGDCVELYMRHTSDIHHDDKREYNRQAIVQ